MTYTFWQGGTPGGLFCHVQTALGACKDWDITNQYKMAAAGHKEAQERMKDAMKLLKAIINEEDDATEKDHRGDHGT